MSINLNPYLVFIESMLFTRISSSINKPLYRSAFISPALQQPLRGFRFGQQTISNNDREDWLPKVRQEKPAWIYKVTAKALSRLDLHPKIIQKLVPTFLVHYAISDKMFNKLYPHQEITFNSPDHIQLKGYWLEAEGGKSNKAIVIGHGYTAKALVMLSLAETFRKHGWNVFIFDFRAHGKSGGETTSFGFHEGKDVAAAILEIKQYFPKASKRLFYLGHSMGASAIMFSPKSLEKYPKLFAQMNRDLDGIILDSPYLHFTNFSIAWLLNQDSSKRSPHQLSRWLIRKINKVFQEIALAWKQEVAKAMHLPFPVEQMEPLHFFRNSPLNQKPILLLHGKKDRTLPFQDAEVIYRGLKAINHKGVDFIALNADHVAKDWELQSRKYYTVLRDRQHYQDALFNFLPS